MIAAVHPKLKDIALTASWEQKLSDMTNGKGTASAFESDIAAFLQKVLPEITRQELPVIAAVNADPGLGECPQCKQGVIRVTSKGAGCSRWKDNCQFFVWKQQYGKKLTDAQLKILVQKRRTPVTKGFKKKDGSGSYDARLVLNDEFKVKLEFDNKN